MNKIVFKISWLFFFVFCIQMAWSQNKVATVHYFNPVFSPDGSSIVFESTRDGESSIYTISPKGKNLKKITDTLYEYGQPSWSPDGKYLVYYGSDHPMQLFTNSYKGGSQQLLATPGQDAYEPDWSPTGKIAFDSRPVGQTPNDLAVMNADGTGFLKLTTDERYESSSPQWSPDGSKILYSRSIAIRKPWKEITKEEMSKKNKSVEIMVMNADGSDSRVMVSPLEGEVAPLWSNDGKAIYYITKQDTTAVLYKVNLGDGEKKPEVLLMLSGVIYSASISPDEKYITYAAERGKKHAIYIQDIKKKEERKLIGD